MEKRLPLHFHFTGRNDRSRNLLLGVGYLLWRCCCRTSNLTTVIQLAPSAPPMPAPVVQAQPPAPIRKTPNHGPKNNANSTSKNNATLNITIT